MTPGLHAELDTFLLNFLQRRNPSACKDYIAASLGILIGKGLAYACPTTCDEDGLILELQHFLKHQSLSDLGSYILALDV